MILFRYILRNHAGPFLFSIFSITAVLLLQYLMKLADKLIGKGLETFVIIQFIAYSLAWIIVLVVPMSVLVSTLMAFGNMSQNNEITIIRSSGISLYKIMVPPLIASFIITLFLIWFNNFIYPDVNHSARIMLEDINRKKPTLVLVPGVFSQEIRNYSILAREINEQTNELKNLLIYTNSKPDEIDIISAENGKLYFSRDQSHLVLDLSNGEIHQTSLSNYKTYRRLQFNKHKISIDAEEFIFQQSSATSRNERELGASDLQKIVDSLEVIKEGFEESLSEDFNRYIFSNSANRQKLISSSSVNTKEIILHRVKERIRSDKNIINGKVYQLFYNKLERYKYLVEIHKKFSIPVACIVFILIGAPLGVMTRKGGFGAASANSLIFFLFYWAFLLGGERFADRGIISPFWGMWSANFILLIMGILLTIKNAKEQVIYNFDFLNRFIPKSLKQLFKDDKNN